MTDYIYHYGGEFETHEESTVDMSYMRYIGELDTYFGGESRGEEVNEYAGENTIVVVGGYRMKSASTMESDIVELFGKFKPIDVNPNSTTGAKSKPDHLSKHPRTGGDDVRDTAGDNATTNIMNELVDEDIVDENAVENNTNDYTIDDYFE